MKCEIALVVGCLSCGIAFGSPPPPPVVTAPSAAVSTPLLEDGGNKLAGSDLPAAIRSLNAAVRADPHDVFATRLLSIALLHARQHERAAETAESFLRHAAPTPTQRAVMALLLGNARYAAFIETYEKCSSQVGSLPNMAQLLSQMSVHEYPTSRGDVIVTEGDVNARDDFDTVRTTFKDTVTRLQQRLSQADTAYQDALTADPHLAGIHDGLGLVRASQGYFGEARREFLKELSLHGPSGSVYLHLGTLDAAEGHNDDAIENLRLAMAFSPEVAASYRALAPLYAKAHDQERSRWALGISELRQGDVTKAGQTLAETSPRTCEMLTGQAQLCLVQKRAGDAKALLAKAQLVDPKNAEVVAMLGDLEDADGHDDRAMALYHQALDRDTACGAAWYGLGLVYDHQNDRESACKDYAQALQINPNNASARLNIAADEADLGRPEKAVADLEDYENRFPTAGNLYVVETALRQLRAK